MNKAKAIRVKAAILAAFMVKNKDLVRRLGTNKGTNKLTWFVL